MAKEGQGKDMAQQSARQDRENQHAPKCSKHAALIWTRSRYSHTGQRHANGRIKGRIHDCTRRALHDPKSYLRQRGCPYMVHGSGVERQPILKEHDYFVACGIGA